MNRVTQPLILSAFLMLVIPATPAGGAPAARFPTVLAVMAVQPDLPLELLKHMTSAAARSLEQISRQELTLALRERARGNLKAMELHLKKAAEHGSKEARALLEDLKSSKGK